MKSIYALFLLVIWLCLSNKALANDCDSSCQMGQINSYFKALDKVSIRGSSIKDIDYFLSLMHADVKYIHVEYEASFDKESWRKAFVRNLERDAYQNTNENEQRVLKAILGKNHVAVEYSHGVIQKDGTWQQKKPLLVLFGFTEGKISLVKELW
ncbi:MULTISPECIES: hypothetical protein [Gammaproteobacteria]|uniref:Nuclear transport factor 2 family protein n=1 Tax=Simiduia curdlanivorans TaxID=1492769 RepID=A0ABV8V584_9GAMM|nr:MULTISPECIES: hypothetical protein [Gammaproteobacteria]MDN3640776.1 hypothetical protein [Simiduia curdlanivorans]MDP5149677.1 hypothetical protein [Rheinheimera baltica]MDP5191806.1 hypothetical protein [Rheinheimera baltica]